MSNVTWLHLSDLHFRSGRGSEEFNREIVLRALWEDIREQIDRGIRPDFIFFTGDVAYSGRQEEYELAQERFFKPLLEITGLTKDRLLIVPGNHDVDWSHMDPITTSGMTGFLTGRDQVNQFLGPQYNRSQAFAKFEGYEGFVNTFLDGRLDFSPQEYFYTRLFQVRGQQVAVVGLNSAWMSACVRDDEGMPLDQGRLLVGERQLEDALSSTSEADLRIALLHHPTDWLAEIDRFRIERRLGATCHFVLHGHWHVPEVTIRRSLGGQAAYIPAGAVYAHRDYPNGYNFVEFDLDTKHVKVFLRRYNDQGPQGPEWTKDIQSTGERWDGVFEFGLEEPSEDVTVMADKRILLVEDQEEWQEVVQSILVPPDFNVRIATSFRDARAALESAEEPFDAIIINLCLTSDTDYEGVVLLDHLRQTKIPCIVLTGAAAQMRGLFERYHVCEAFVKGRGFNRARFRSVINEVIEGHSEYVT